MQILTKAEEQALDVVTTTIHDLRSGLYSFRNNKFIEELRDKLEDLNDEIEEHLDTYAPEAE